MKINSIPQNNFYKTTNAKGQNALCLDKGLKSDCFIRSNSLSFGASNAKSERARTVKLFMKDLGARVQSPKFSISDISYSMQKYVKNVSVKPMSKAPKELLFSDSLQGLYCEELKFNSQTNEFFIPKKNRVFYTKTETLKKELGNVWVFVNSVHEFTHALQSDDSSLNQADLFNSYVDKNKNDIDGATNQVMAAIKAVNVIEESVARPFINLLIDYENIAFSREQSGQNDYLSWLCRKNKTQDFDEYAKEKIQEGIQSCEKTQGIKPDKTLVIDATINHFKKELEAYENENEAFKMCLGMNSPRALTRVQIYEKSIKVLEEMKKEAE